MHAAPWLTMRRSAHNHHQRSEPQQRSEQQRTAPAVQSAQHVHRRTDLLLTSCLHLLPPPPPHPRTPATTAQHIWPLLEGRVPQWVASSDWQRRLTGLQTLAWAVAECPVKPTSRMKALAGLGVALTKDSHLRVRCGALVLLGGMSNMNSNSDEAQKLWQEREAGVFGAPLTDDEYLQAVCGAEALDAMLACLGGDDEAQWAIACDGVNGFSRDDVASFEPVTARAKDIMTKLLAVLQRARTPAVSTGWGRGRRD